MPNEVDNADATELKVQPLAGLAALALAATGLRRRTTVDGSREPVPSSTGAQ